MPALTTHLVYAPGTQPTLTSRLM